MASASDQNRVVLDRMSNQAFGLASFAIRFMSSGAGERGRPSQAVLGRTMQFFVDAAVCGISALAARCNAPQVLRQEAMTYFVPKGKRGATVFGSRKLVRPEKAVVANCAAVREWDANGTNFGNRPELGHSAGEFGHNDFYAVPIAAAQLRGRSGKYALLGMVLLDEIRGRLAEVFALKNCYVDHVLHGAIASAVVYGAMMGAKAEQIESAIGMVVAHYVPFRAIRAGHALSDSKGASAALSAELAVLSVHRAMRGFEGPKDIFRNPQAIFRLFQGPGQKLQRVGETVTSEASSQASPFDLVLSMAGDDFAVMSMHFKLGLYEHQSAGAIQALMDMLAQHPNLFGNGAHQGIERIRIRIYEPAFGIICDPHKANPTNRQSADHSMVYIVATLLRKAMELQRGGWDGLMLLPPDYEDWALYHELTRTLMGKIEVLHGGAEYDEKYPDGIPTSMEIEMSGRTLDSGLVMYPGGHARNHLHQTPVDLQALLAQKCQALLEPAVRHPADVTERLRSLPGLPAHGLATLYHFPIEGCSRN